jgi:integrase
MFERYNIVSDADLTVARTDDGQSEGVSGLRSGVRQAARGSADELGEPCYALADSHFRRVVKAAGVKVIGVHGMRHTCATLLLAAGEPVKDVADRLGHEKPSMTLDVYTHATAGAQRDAAGRLDAALSGR